MSSQWKKPAHQYLRETISKMGLDIYPHEYVQDKEYPSRWSVHFEDLGIELMKSDFAPNNKGEIHVFYEPALYDDTITNWHTTLEGKTTADDLLHWAGYR